MKKRRRKEGESVKQARTLERGWNKSMMNVQLAVFNQGSKQGLSVWAASLSRLKLSPAHKATSAGCINYSKDPFWPVLWRTNTSRGLGWDKIVLCMWKSYFSYSLLHLTLVFKGDISVEPQDASSSLSFVLIWSVMIAGAIHRLPITEARTVHNLHFRLLADSLLCHDLQPAEHAGFSLKDSLTGTIHVADVQQVTFTFSGWTWWPAAPDDLPVGYSYGINQGKWEDWLQEANIWFH